MTPDEVERTPAIVADRLLLVHQATNLAQHMTDEARLDLVAGLMLREQAGE